jgi:hypothetical protein
MSHKLGGPQLANHCHPFLANVARAIFFTDYYLQDTFKIRKSQRTVQISNDIPDEEEFPSGRDDNMPYFGWNNPLTDLSNCLTTWNINAIALPFFFSKVEEYMRESRTSYLRTIRWMYIPM